MNDRELLQWWSHVGDAVLHTNYELNKDLSQQSGLSPAWLSMLGRLQRAPQQRMSMTDLASAMAMTTGGLTRLADRLVEAGLVERSLSSEDRRRVFLSLTPSGQSTADEMTEIQAEALRRRFESLSPSEFQNLTRAMRQMALELD